MSKTRAELREAIIKVSLDLGNELGEEGLTMRGIASRLGVSATALYQHFESKSQILNEIRSFGVEGLWKAMEPAMGVEDFEQRLTQMVIAYVKFARENPWLYTVLMEHEEVDWTKVKEEDLDSALKPLLELRKALEYGQKQGVISDKVDVATSSLQCWAAVHGLCSLFINGRISEKHPMFPAPDEEALVKTFAKVLVGTVHSAG
jgi:AcrR family transcriptional regulator